ncbi:MAG: GxxExxY protein [Gemmatimonadales bacterium]
MHSTTDYPHQALTRTIIGGFYEVYNALGSGFREIVYQRALAIALTERGLDVEREVPMTVFFHQRSVGTFRADLVVGCSVLLELKALPELQPSHVAQIINELRATRLEVGLLLNFGPTPQIKRLIAGQRDTDSADRHRAR